MKLKKCFLIEIFEREIAALSVSSYSIKISRVLVRETRRDAKFSLTARPRLKKSKILMSSVQYMNSVRLWLFMCSSDRPEQG